MLDLILAFLAFAGLCFAFWVWRGYVAPAPHLLKICQDILEGRRPSHFVIHGKSEVEQSIRVLESIDMLVRKQREALEAEEFNLQGILSSMVEAVIVVSPASRILLANSEFSRMFGLTTPPAGKTVLEAVRHHELMGIIRETLESGNRILGREVYLPHLLDPGSMRRHASVNATPLRNSKGEMHGAVVVFHDNTQLRQMEQERRDFVANTSHELRTPLSIFQGYLEAMLDSDPMSWSEIRRILLILQRHSNRLNFLVKDLLTLSRLESKRLLLNPAPTDIYGFIEHLLNDAQRNPALHGHRLESEIDANLPAIPIDPVRIEQVLHNLLDNAAKYSPEKGVILLTARHLPDSNEVVFSVEDHGVGIPPGDLPRIFERFYRVDKARSRDLGGTGLGLTIVKHIILAHQGRVWAESEVGRGTKLFFALPLVLANSSSLASSPVASELVASR